MLPLLFLSLACVFVTLLYRAHAAGEILARGWGFSTRHYSRDDDPVMYWVTFISYVICAVLGMAAGMLLAFHHLS